MDLDTRAELKTTLLIQESINKKVLDFVSGEQLYSLIDHFFTLDKALITSLYMVLCEGGEHYWIATHDEAIPHLKKIVKGVITSVHRLAEFGYDIDPSDLPSNIRCTELSIEE